MDEYLVPTTEAIGEFTEKRSQFLGHIFPVETEEEALAQLKKVREKHWNATHNVYAYIIKDGPTRFSDDGEPGGTAGMPVLQVLQREGVYNVLCVATRYFGGVLLGAGGLVRAYTQAAHTGLAMCKKALMCRGKRLKIHTDYNTIGKVLYELGQRGIDQEDSEYTDVVVITVVIPNEDVAGLEKRITEISAGKNVVEVVEEIRFAKEV